MLQYDAIVTKASKNGGFSSIWSRQRGMIMTVLLDDLDRRLITLLMEDASRTNVFLARELGVSDGTVRNRIQNLIEKGVMEIVAVVDPWKVGHKLQIICGK